MAIVNNQRKLVQIISEVCEENKIKYDSFSFDWIFRLEKDEKQRFIVGYTLDLNSSATNHLLIDKSATSDILEFHKIPHIEHTFFMKPFKLEYIGENGNWQNIINCANDYTFPVVCKPNKGSGGKYVYKVNNQFELEKAVYNIFSKYRDMTISPFYEIQNEYRVFMLDNNVEYIYKKQNVIIVGDGQKTLRELFTLQYPSYSLDDLVRNMDEEVYQRLDEVIKSSEKIDVIWQFNLGKGAIPNDKISNSDYQKISVFALQISKALNVRFATIDIIKSDNLFLLLEVNGGVMLEHFIENINGGYEIAKKIYEKAILLMFN